MSGGVDGNPLILATALLLAGGVLLSKTSAKLGVPGLLLFLGLGMVAGSEGVFDIEFDNFDIAAEFGTIALAFILFSCEPKIQCKCPIKSSFEFRILYVFSNCTST